MFKNWLKNEFKIVNEENKLSKKHLGVITQGSLSGGLEMRLSPDISVEDVRVGKFVVVEGIKNRFFSMLTDVSLGTSNPKILLAPPDPV